MNDQTQAPLWHELAALLVAGDQPAKALKILGKPQDATTAGALVGVLAAALANDAKARDAWMAALDAIDQQRAKDKQPIAHLLPAKYLVLASLTCGQPERAREHLSRAADSGTALKAALVEAVEHAADGGKTEAARLLQACVAIDMEQSPLARSLAIEALKARPQCQWAAAIAFEASTDLKQMGDVAAALGPADCAQALMLRASLTVQDRKLDAAAALYAQAAAADGGNPNLVIRQAQTLELAGKLPEALALYRQVYDKTHRADAANAVAYLTSQLNPRDDAKLAEARKLADEAFGAAPLAAWRDTKGWVAFLQQRHQEACVDLRAAAVAMSESPEVHYHLGAAEAAAGNKDFARWHLSAALALGKQIQACGQFLSPGQDQAIAAAQKALTALN